MKNEWKSKFGKHKLTLPIGAIELKWNHGSWSTYFNNQNLHSNGLNIEQLKQKALKIVGEKILESVVIIDELTVEENNKDESDQNT